MQAQYLGPCIVISRNKLGAYIITELDGSVFDQPVAAFQVIPYFTCSKIMLPLLDLLINISSSQLKQLEDPEAVDLKEDDEETESDLLDDE